MPKRTSKAHREAGTATHIQEGGRGGTYKPTENELKRREKSKSGSGKGMTESEYKSLSSTDQQKLKDTIAEDIKNGKVDIHGSVDYNAFRYGDPEIKLEMKSPLVKDNSLTKTLALRTILNKELDKPSKYSKEIREKFKKGEKVNLTQAVKDIMNKQKTSLQEARQLKAAKALYSKDEYEGN